MNDYFGSSLARLAETAALDSDVSFFLLVIKAYLAQIKHLGYNVTGTLHKYNLDKAPVPYYQVAFSYEQSGEPLKAIEQYEVFMAKYPTHAWRDQAAKRVVNIKANL